MSTGETVTLTATLVDMNGNPVNGATIIFMEGNTTLYSSITNNLGVINYTYSSTVEGSKSLKCVFEGNTNYNGNVSGNVIITINKYIVFPSAYASNTGSVSVTDNVYSLQLNNMGEVGVYNAGYPLYNDESYTITCQIKNSNINNAQCGLGVVSKTNTAYHTYIYLESITPVYQIRVIKNYSDSYLNKQSLPTDYRNIWLNYKIVLNGTSFTYTVTDTNNTTIYSGTITLGADLNTTLYPAIFAGWDACTVQFKNLQIM